MRHLFFRISKTLTAIILLILTCTTFASGNSLPDLSQHKDERSLSNPSYVLGQYWFRKLNGSGGLIEFPPAYNYLEQAISQILPNTDLSNKTIDIALLNSQQTNAFVIPGNHLFIYSDLVKLIDTEASFMGLLSHEIAHLELNHYERSIENQKNEQAKNLMLLFVGAVAASQGNGDVSSALLIGGLANQLENMLRHSRAHELEADRRGRELLEKSGIPVSGMNGLLYALFKQSIGSNRIEFLSTHPLPQNRISDALTGQQRNSVVFQPSSKSFQYFRATLLAYRAVLDGSKYIETLQSYLTEPNLYLYAKGLAEVLQQNADKAINTLSQLNEKNDFTEYLRAMAEISANKKDQALSIIQNQLTLSPSNLTFRSLLPQTGKSHLYLPLHDHDLSYEKRMIYRHNITLAKQNNELDNALFYQALLEFSRGREEIAMSLINRAEKNAPQKQIIAREKSRLELIIEAERDLGLRQ